MSSSLHSRQQPFEALSSDSAAIASRGELTEMLSASVRACTVPFCRLKARVMALEPFACAAKSLGDRSRTPIDSSSLKPLPSALRMLPSPVGTIIQSGAFHPSCSAIS